MGAIQRQPRSQSGKTSWRKFQQPYRLRAAKNQASCYCSSWRGLQSDASTPDDSRLITPETTPPSIPTNPATGPVDFVIDFRIPLLWLPLQRDKFFLAHYEIGCTCQSMMNL